MYTLLSYTALSALKCDPMHKDFAKRKKRPIKRSRHRPGKVASRSTFFIPAWIWMGSGLVLGLVLSALLYAQIHPDQTQTPAVTIAIHEKPPLPQPQKNTAKRFEFYSVLADNEGQAALYRAPAATKHKSVASLDKPKAFTNHQPVHEPTAKSFKPYEAKPFVPLEDRSILQVGSFKQYDQADKLRTQLTQTGFKASIQTFKLNPSETWYRVYLGPYNNREDALQQQAKLEQSQPIHSLIVKYRV